MKLLRVLGSMDPRTGGVAQAIRSLHGSLKKFGIECEVATSDSPEAGWLGRDPFPIHPLGPGRFGYAYSPRWLPWLSKNLPRFDAVLLDGLWQWPGLAARVARSRHAPATKLFAMPHGMLDPWFQRDPQRRWKAIRNFAYWTLVERSTVNGCNGLFFTCDEERSLARTTFPGYKPRAESTVGLGIEDPVTDSTPASATFRDSIPSLGQSPYILYLGRIDRKKGLDLLIRARMEIPNSRYHLVIAGPGWDSPHGRDLMNLIQEATRRRDAAPAFIHAVNLLEGPVKWAALRECAAFILPSHQENFGLAVVEALACDRPVLLSDKVNIAPEIAAEGAGLVEPDTLKGTRRLLERFESGFARPQGEVRDCYQRHFSVESSAERLASALRTLP